jgi:iron(III) transport system ATP-binding protein
MDGLKLENISHRFGEKVVIDHLDLTVEKGQIVCLLGPSGCGKTTTLRIAAGLESLQSGNVFINGSLVGQPGREVPTENRQIGLVFQDYALFPHLTVSGNIEFGLHKLPLKEKQARIDSLLDRLDIARHRNSYPHVLSGGEQQRVALARALVAEPSVMLMDEPFANLDVRLRDRVRDDTLRLLREEGSATLLVTHDPEEAMLMADKIAVMSEGRIIQFGSPEELFDAPQCRFVAEFFGDLNVLRGRASECTLVTSGLGELKVDKAKGFTDGTEVDVLVRPDSLHIGTNGSGIQGKLLSTRPVGAFAVAEVELLASGERVKARFPRKTELKIGDQINIAVDPAQIFVFSAKIT